MLKSGIDLVYIPKLSGLLQDKHFLKKVFHENERNPCTPEHLAGIFAAKEAFFKALNQNPKWLNIEIKKENGAPYLEYSKEYEIKSSSISISHEKDYAVAQVILEL